MPGSDYLTRALFPYKGKEISAGVDNADVISGEQHCETCGSRHAATTNIVVHDIVINDTEDLALDSDLGREIVLFLQENLGNGKILCVNCVFDRIDGLDPDTE